MISQYKLNMNACSTATIIISFYINKHVLNLKETSIYYWMIEYCSSKYPHLKSNLTFKAFHLLVEWILKEKKKLIHKMFQKRLKFASIKVVQNKIKMRLFHHCSQHTLKRWSSKIIIILRIIAWISTFKHL